MDLARRPKDLIPQPGIHRQPRCYVDVVLHKRRKVCVSLVSAEEPRTAAAERHIADSLLTLVLRSALAQQKVVERRNVQEPVHRKRRIYLHLVSLRLRAQAEALASARP